MCTSCNVRNGKVNSAALAGARLAFARDAGELEPSTSAADYRRIIPAISLHPR